VNYASEMIKQNWRGVPVGATYTEDRGEHGRISFDRSHQRMEDRGEEESIS